MREWQEVLGGSPLECLHTATLRDPSRLTRIEESFAGQLSVATSDDLRVRAMTCFVVHHWHETAPTREYTLHDALQLSD